MNNADLSLALEVSRDGFALFAVHCDIPLECLGEVDQTAPERDSDAAGLQAALAASTISTRQCDIWFSDELVIHRKVKLPAGTDTERRDAAASALAATTAYNIDGLCFDVGDVDLDGYTPIVALPARRLEQATTLARTMQMTAVHVTTSDDVAGFPDRPRFTPYVAAAENRMDMSIAAGIAAVIAIPVIGFLSGFVSLSPNGAADGGVIVAAMAETASDVAPGAKQEAAPALLPELGDTTRARVERTRTAPLVAPVMDALPFVGGHAEPPAKPEIRVVAVDLPVMSDISEMAAVPLPLDYAIGAPEPLGLRPVYRAAPHLRAPGAADSPPTSDMTTAANLLGGSADIVDLVAAETFDTTRRDVSGSGFHDAHAYEVANIPAGILVRRPSDRPRQFDIPTRTLTLAVPPRRPRAAVEDPGAGILAAPEMPPVAEPPDRTPAAPAAAEIRRPDHRAPFALNEPRRPALVQFGEISAAEAREAAIAAAIFAAGTAEAYQARPQDRRLALLPAGDAARVLFKTERPDARATAETEAPARPLDWTDNPPLRGAVMTIPLVRRDAVTPSLRSQKSDRFIRQVALAVDPDSPLRPRPPRRPGVRDSGAQQDDTTTEPRPASEAALSPPAVPTETEADQQPAPFATGPGRVPPPARPVVLSPPEPSDVVTDRTTAPDPAPSASAILRLQPPARPLAPESPAVSEPLSQSWSTSVPASRPTPSAQAATAAVAPVGAEDATEQVAILTPLHRPASLARTVNRVRDARREAERQVAARQEPARTTPSNQLRIPSNARVSSVATVENAINLGDVSLIGIMGKSSARRALIRLPQGRIIRVSRGESFSGWTVSAIDDSGVRIQRRGQNKVLRLPN